MLLRFQKSGVGAHQWSPSHASVCCLPCAVAFIQDAPNYLKRAYAEVLVICMWFSIFRTFEIRKIGEYKQSLYFLLLVLKTISKQHLELWSSGCVWAWYLVVLTVWLWVSKKVSTCVVLARQIGIKSYYLGMVLNPVSRPGSMGFLVAGIWLWGIWQPPLLLQRIWGVLMFFYGSFQRFPGGLGV